MNSQDIFHIVVKQFVAIRNVFWIRKHPSRPSVVRASSRHPVPFWFLLTCQGQNIYKSNDKSLGTKAGKEVNWNRNIYAVYFSFEKVWICCDLLMSTLHIHNFRLWYLPNKWMMNKLIFKEKIFLTFMNLKTKYCKSTLPKLIFLS